MDFIYESSPLLKFTFHQLFKSYIHIGFIKRYSHPLFSFYILGYYYNVGIINLNFSITFFRISIFFLKGIIMNRGRLLLVNENFTNLNISLFPEILSGFRNCFIFDRWTKGLLTNLRTIIRRRQSSRTQFNKIRRMPSLVFFLHCVRNDEFSSLNEVKKLKIPYIKIIDNEGNPFSHQFWIPGNVTSIHSRFFYLNIITILLEKFFFMKMVRVYRRMRAKGKWRSIF